ncbi:hypothetical protein HMPREF9954_1972 [Streptococcus infantis SK970]|nr:hypothetical protein HMPREF9954_1972 [Streptococcus infantis SK970]
MEKMIKNTVIVYHKFYTFSTMRASNRKERTFYDKKYITKKERLDTSFKHTWA